MATSGMMSIGGLGSGLQIDSILAQLDQVARAPVSRLQSQKQEIATQRQAWENWNTRLLAIMDRAQKLSDLSKQMTMTATSSDSAVTVTTGDAASPGLYSFTVDSLSSYHQLASTNSFAPDASVGSGSISITVGGKQKTVSVENATLAQLRDAINAAGAGVTASIISESATSQRLVLTSKTLGTGGAMTVDFSGLSGGAAPDMSHVLTEAQDTRLTFDAGTPQAFTVTRVGRTLTDVIEGVTLSLTDAAIGKDITVRVEENQESVKVPIVELVNQYNVLNELFGALNTYNADTQETGPLFGNYTLRSMFSDITDAITGQLTGTTSGLTSLAQIGITAGEDGKLTIDQAALDDALTTRRDDVYNLFSLVTSATNSSVTYLSAADDTRSSGTDGFAVHIDHVATQARLTLGTPLPATLGQQEVLTLNGVAITLESGSTPTAIVDALNDRSADTGVTASLGVDGQQLILTQQSYGSRKRVAIFSDLDAATANSTGIGVNAISDSEPGTGNTGAAGQDVSGTIGGEAASGDGRVLTGTAGAAKGLALRISATDAGDGDFGTVQYIRGIGSLLESRLSTMTDLVNGSIKAIDDDMDARTEILDKSITDTNDAVDRELEAMRTKFNAMDVTIARLRNQSSALSAQIASLGINSSMYSSSS